jgi:hypothetical protein
MQSSRSATAGLALAKRPAEMPQSEGRSLGLGRRRMQASRSRFSWLTATAVQFMRVDEMLLRQKTKENWQLIKASKKMNWDCLASFHEWYDLRRKSGLFITAHEHETTIP